jgi:hypothetical protein
MLHAQPLVGVHQAVFHEQFAPSDVRVGRGVSVNIKVRQFQFVKSVTFCRDAIDASQLLKVRSGQLVHRGHSQI